MWNSDLGKWVIALNCIFASHLVLSWRYNAHSIFFIHVIFKDFSHWPRTLWKVSFENLYVEYQRPAYALKSASTKTYRFYHWCVDLNHPQVSLCAPEESCKRPMMRGSPVLSSSSRPNHVPLGLATHGCWMNGLHAPWRYEPLSCDGTTLNLLFWGGGSHFVVGSTTSHTASQYSHSSHCTRIV